MIFENSRKLAETRKRWSLCSAEIVISDSEEEETKTGALADQHTTGPDQLLHQYLPHQLIPLSWTPKTSQLHSSPLNFSRSRPILRPAAHSNGSTAARPTTFVYVAYGRAGSQKGRKSTEAKEEAAEREERMMNTLLLLMLRVTTDELRWSKKS